MLSVGKRIRLISLAMLIGLAQAPCANAADTVETQTLVYLDTLRNLKAEGDTATMQANNEAMDKAWKFFGENKAAVLPVLRANLAAELAKPHPSDLLLLDIGHYLFLQNESGDRDLAKRALYAVDLSASMVKVNHQALFELTLGVAST